MGSMSDCCEEIDPELCLLAPIVPVILGNSALPPSRPQGITLLSPRSEIFLVLKKLILDDTGRSPRDPRGWIIASIHPTV